MMLIPVLGCHPGPLFLTILHEFFVITKLQDSLFFLLLFQLTVLLVFLVEAYPYCLLLFLPPPLFCHRIVKP